MKPLASKNLRPTKKGRITATCVGQNILQCFVYNIAIIYFYYTRFLMCFNNYLQIGLFIINNLRVHIIVNLMGLPHRFVWGYPIIIFYVCLLTNIKNVL
jgi:hypothetical protein